jgi:hypothetical protein
MTRCNTTASQNGSADISSIGQTNSENLCHCPPSGARRGGGDNTTTSQGGRPEAAARQQVEALVDRRWRHDKIQHNKQPGWICRHLPN